eukprot:Plantae.Rhodophyta-Purpureofilum_apyrenoidigerum.ctg52280.p1 GENE.Plantae.Rhodophyta-Purpureofilum_apyrenoidigerum.ctg52280~~Plantae.Rhodophyta-Purpureofilum_apyrenoidigerum.ctg52280.p1  ORF type:complete len:156 (-),score=31.39 Plantae.Rhodophyta-Purpureofilum_apyrenoidigerum.ctg52280:130-597(-)
MSTREGGGAGLVRRAVAAADVRTNLYRRFEDRINAVASSFQNVLEAAVVEDRAMNAIGEYQVEIEAASIARSCEDILRILSEIEIASITQDTAGAVQDIEKVVMPTYKKIVNSTEGILGAFRDSVNTSLQQLERHYYTSQSSIPPIEPVTPSSEK